jgi:RNA-directed DNA polymerase
LGFRGLIKPISGLTITQSDNYWSGTTNANWTGSAWNINFNNGNVNNNDKDNVNYVRPVRSCQRLVMEEIFSFKNIYRCYLACRCNKRNTINALNFERNAEENILKLQRELKSKTYRPSHSILFAARKPKLREIFAADFRDRVVHHILVDYLERIWENIFIYDSYACREEKGTHKAVKRLQSFLRKISRNGKVKTYFLQLDIKDFFTSIDKRILFNLFKKKISNSDILWLVETVIFWDCTKSYTLKDTKGVVGKIPSNKSLFGKENKRGLPIGNLTSQFFANVYLNELDQFVKHILKVKYYVRYVDDFIILDVDRNKLLKMQDEIEEFLKDRLILQLHPTRRKLLPVTNGIDFLGYIVRRNYILVRNRVINNLMAKYRRFVNNGKKDIKGFQNSLASYLGHLKWANTYCLVKRLKEKGIITIS